MKKALWGGLLMSSYLFLAQPLGAQEILSISFPDPRLTVSGLPWFKEDSPKLCRLPGRMKDRFPKKVWEMALCPSGGRIQFRTNSSKLILKAECESDYTMYHITSIAQNGFDLYVDGFYQGSTGMVGQDHRVSGVWDLGPQGVEREITLYMPLYKAVTVLEIGLDKKAEIKPPHPFAKPKPVVYYGTSITQGLRVQSGHELSGHPGPPPRL